MFFGFCLRRAGPLALFTSRPARNASKSASRIRRRGFRLLRFLETFTARSSPLLIHSSTVRTETLRASATSSVDSVFIEPPRTAGFRMVRDNPLKSTGQLVRPAISQVDRGERVSESGPLPEGLQPSAEYSPSIPRCRRSCRIFSCSLLVLRWDSGRCHSKKRATPTWLW